MRFGFFIFLSFILSCNVFCQKIDYKIPVNFADTISGSDYKKIVDLSVVAISKKYTVDSVYNASVSLKINEDITAFNLDNLIFKCVADTNKENWDNIVNDHFTRLFTSMDFNRTLNLKDYNSIKSYLSLRIYPKKYVETYGEKMIYKKDLEGTFTVLMLDLPNAFTTVDRESFNFWKKDSTEVFKEAQKNINKHQISKLTEKFKVDKAEIEIIFIEEENYAASYALDLMNNSAKFVGEWGSVIAIPNKQVVMACEVSKKRPTDFVQFIQLTYPLVQKQYHEHPQPITDHFFWYYKGEFTPIIMSFDDSQNIKNIFAPPGLSELMSVKK